MHSITPEVPRGDRAARRNGTSRGVDGVAWRQALEAVEQSLKEAVGATTTRNDVDTHVTKSVSVDDGANGRFTKRDARRTGQATTATSARARVGESADNAGVAQPLSCERQEKGGGVRDVEGLRVCVTEGVVLGDEESVIDDDGDDVGDNEEVGDDVGDNDEVWDDVGDNEGVRELERELDGVGETVAVTVSEGDVVGDRDGVELTVTVGEFEAVDVGDLDFVRLHVGDRVLEGVCDDDGFISRKARILKAGFG